MADDPLVDQIVSKLRALTPRGVVRAEGFFQREHGGNWRGQYAMSPFGEISEETFQKVKKVLAEAQPQLSARERQVNRLRARADGVA